RPPVPGFHRLGQPTNRDRGGELPRPARLARRGAQRVSRHRCALGAGFDRDDRRPRPRFRRRPLGPRRATALRWAPRVAAGQLRLPRAVFAFLVGGALGVSGVGLQALVRNPLADPFLLGLSGGAGLGAVVAIAFDLPGPWALPLAAFVGAVGAMALVYRLGLMGGAELDPRILLLGGVAVGAFAGAITTAIVSLAQATELRNAFLWLWGGFSGASWTTVLVMVVYAPLPLAVLAAAARPLDLLALGE